MKKENVIAILVVFGVAIGIVVMVYHFAEKKEKREKVQKTVNLVQSEAKKRLSGRHNTNVKDSWGNELIYAYDETEEFKLASATSMGPDGLLDTEDDIAQVASDFNKSRIVGEWAGKRIKEGVKGFVKGLKSESDFKKSE